MNRSCDVLFALTGDARRNSRALRQLRLLAEDGHSIRLLSVGGGSDDELPDAVTVDALPTPPGSGPRFFLTLHRLFEQATAGIRAAVYHASDLFCLPAMAQASAKHGGKLVYDSRELYTALGSAYRRPWTRGVWYVVERRHIRRADVVLTVNESIADRLQSLYRIAPPVVLANVPTATEVQPSGQLRAMARIPEGSPLVLYQGYLKPGRGCMVLLEAIRELPDAHVVYIGEGRLAHEIEATASRYHVQERVRLVPMVHPDEVLRLTADADVGACLIEDLSLSLRLALPNKLFEYAAARVPVIGSDLPEIARLIRNFDIGLVARPGDVLHTRQVLAEMLLDAGARRRWAANTRALLAVYDPAEIGARFQAVYRRLLGVAV